MKKLNLLFLLPITVLSSGAFTVSCGSKDKPEPEPGPTPTPEEYSVVVNGDDHVSGALDRITDESWIFVNLNLEDGYKLTKIELFDGETKIDEANYTFEPREGTIQVYAKNYVKSKKLVVNLTSDETTQQTIDVNQSIKSKIWSTEKWIIAPNEVTDINCYDTFTVNIDTSKWGGETWGTLHKVQFVKNDSTEELKNSFFYNDTTSITLNGKTLEEGTPTQVYAGIKDFCFNNPTAESSYQMNFKQNLINKGDKLIITLKFKEFNSTTYPCFLERGS